MTEEESEERKRNGTDSKVSQKTYPQFKFADSSDRLKLCAGRTANRASDMKSATFIASIDRFLPSLRMNGPLSSAWKGALIRERARLCRHIRGG